LLLVAFWRILKGYFVRHSRLDEPVTGCKDAEAVSSPDGRKKRKKTEKLVWEARKFLCFSL
jgi:hypothetical protein